MVKPCGSSTRLRQPLNNEDIRNALSGILKPSGNRSRLVHPWNIELRLKVSGVGAKPEGSSFSEEQP